MTRVISQKYAVALRETRLTITQFTLLTVLTELRQARVTDLSEALAMDQTTLSRTLKVMHRLGLISRVEGEDQRESRWALTARGRDRRQRALPRWEAAQNELEERLGPIDAQRFSRTAFDFAARLMR